MADDFQATQNPPAKIDCTNKNLAIQFAGIKKSYILYDKNSSSVKLLSCEKIKVRDLEFYTVLFSSEIHDGANIQKVLTFEVALLNKKSGNLLPVRSEIVDQVEITGDLTNTNFESSLKAEWGQNKKDDRVLMKIEIKTKNEKPLSYILKLNPKMTWFENLFEKK